MVNIEKLDRLDIEILKRLQDDARVKFTEIARELGVSEGTIRFRLKSLVDRGLIRGFIVVLDPYKLGFKVFARIGIDADLECINDIVSEISRLKEVYFVALSTGRHDILVDVIVKDLDELKRLLTEKIGRIRGVRNVDVSIVMDVYKWRVRPRSFKDLT